MATNPNGNPIIVEQLEGGNLFHGPVFWVHIKPIGDPGAPDVGTYSLQYPLGGQIPTEQDVSDKIDDYVKFYPSDGQTCVNFYQLWCVGPEG